MLLSKLMNRAAVALGKQPSSVSKVDGFSIAVEKKQGVLLTAEKDGERIPASQDAYLEVTINVDGSNPEYPASESPYVKAFTVAAQKDRWGFSNGTYYIPAGCKWTGFELVEVYDECKEPPIGKWMPAHHRVDLVAHYQDSLKQPQKMSMSSWVRKSDRESNEWKAAARCPITYC